MTTSTLRWHVVQTQIHAEQKAAANLLRQGYEVYLPRYLKRRRHARRVEIVATPLFPRYLFVAFDIATARWRSIRSTYGVSHLVCHNQEPAALPEKVVTDLRCREDDKGFVRLDARPQYAPGDKIRVVEGVFSESMGLFEGMSDRDRVAILLDLLGRKVRIILDRDFVAAA